MNPVEAFPHPPPSYILSSECCPAKAARPPNVRGFVSCSCHVRVIPSRHCAKPERSVTLTAALDPPRGPCPSVRACPSYTRIHIGHLSPMEASGRRCTAAAASRVRCASPRAMCGKRTSRTGCFGFPPPCTESSERGEEGGSELAAVRCLLVRAWSWLVLHVADLCVSGRVHAARASVAAAGQEAAERARRSEVKERAVHRNAHDNAHGAGLVRAARARGQVLDQDALALAAEVAVAYRSSPLRYRSAPRLPSHCAHPTGG